MSILSDIKNHFLTEGIQSDIIDKMLEEYSSVKTEALKGDAEKVTLHSARFSDLALVFVDNYLNHTTIDVENIRTDSVINQLLNQPKLSSEETMLTLAIPRITRSIHTIRNKKDVAHVKNIDPDFFDIVLCESSCDWILSQFVSIIYGSNISEIKKTINILVEKKVPWIQEFEDGSKMLLLSGLEIKDQIILTLYNSSPSYIPLIEISKTMIYPNTTYMKKMMGQLKTDKLVHELNESSNNYRLTRPGERLAEKLLVSKGLI